MSLPVGGHGSVACSDWSVLIPEVFRKEPEIEYRHKARAKAKVKVSAKARSDS